jgi:hypothetical protein
MSFDDRIVKWVKDILSFGTSKNLLNGVPRKQFSCKRGVRQGGPFITNLAIGGK